jgi:hypothetical protein
MRVTFALAAVVCTLAAGCGGEQVDPIPAGEVPGVTAPGTALPYENGGADGSGSDGRKEPESKGGVAAGRDVGSGS